MLRDAIHRRTSSAESPAGSDFRTRALTSAIRRARPARAQRLPSAQKRGDRARELIPAGPRIVALRRRSKGVICDLLGTSRPSTPDALRLETPSLRGSNCGSKSRPPQPSNVPPEPRISALRRAMSASPLDASRALRTEGPPGSGGRLTAPWPVRRCASPRRSPAHHCAASRHHAHRMSHLGAGPIDLHPTPNPHPLPCGSTVPSATRRLPRAPRGRGHRWLPAREPRPPRPALVEQASRGRVSPAAI
jgi:hypothetical protein